MKIAFAILLVVAGVCASKVEPTQGRIYDLWVKDMINRGIDFILNRGWDPLVVDKRDIEIVIISRQAEARGTIENLKVTGASNFGCDNLSYNFLLGRLDFDCSHRGVRATLGHADLELIYGDLRGKGDASGSLEVRDVRIKGHALLKHDSSGQPWIYNINTELQVGGVQSEGIGEAVYCSGWENGIVTVPGVRTSILLILARARKPVRLSAGGMYDLTLEAYTTMVKTSYSALTVLLRLR